MPSVLVVDDSSDTRMIARLILETEGYSIAEASDGEEALAILVSGRIPDVILLDLRMPRVDGFEVLETMAANPALADVPVVVFTAHLEMADDERLIDGEARWLLLKPFQPDELVRFVERAVVRST